MMRRGFTLVELLIVIVVIAILAAISIVAYNGIQNRAEATRVSTAVSQYIKLIEMYRVDHGEFPSSIAAESPSSGEVCLGRPADYPQDGDMPAGYCLYDVDYPSWRISSSAALTSQLEVYGTLPVPSQKIAEFSTERWRGIRYREGVNLGKQFAEIQWLAHGNNEEYCLASSDQSASFTNAGVTWCQVVLY